MSSLGNNYKAALDAALGAQADITSPPAAAANPLNANRLAATTALQTAMVAEEADAVATLSTAQSFTGGVVSVVPFDGTKFDTDGAVTTGASARFTCPAGKGGTFLVSALLTFNSGSASGQYILLMLYKNGSEYLRLDRRNMMSAALLGVNGAVLIQLAAGDYIDLRVNIGTTTAVEANPNSNYMSVVRMPGR